MQVRVCPECDEEYRPDIAVCADCGADLVDRQVDEAGRVVESGPAQAPDGEAAEAVPATALFTGPATTLRPLAETLARAGVPFRIAPTEGVVGNVALSVPTSESATALAALAEFVGRGTELGFTELAATFGGDHEGDAACPACSAQVPVDAPACPECGLELGGVEEP